MLRRTAAKAARSAREITMRKSIIAAVRCCAGFSIHNDVGIARLGGAVIETRFNNTVRENVTNNTVGSPFIAVGGT